MEIQNTAFSQKNWTQSEKNHNKIEHFVCMPPSPHHAMGSAGGIIYTTHFFVHKNHNITDMVPSFFYGA